MTRIFLMLAWKLFNMFEASYEYFPGVQVSFISLKLDKYMKLKMFNFGHKKDSSLCNIFEKYSRFYFNARFSCGDSKAKE